MLPHQEYIIYTCLYLSSIFLILHPLMTKVSIPFFSTGNGSKDLECTEIILNFLRFTGFDKKLSKTIENTIDYYRWFWKDFLQLSIAPTIDSFPPLIVVRRVQPISGGMSLFTNRIFIFGPMNNTWFVICKSFQKSTL